MQVGCRCCAVTLNVCIRGRGCPRHPRIEPGDRHDRNLTGKCAILSSSSMLSAPGSASPAPAGSLKIALVSRTVFYAPLWVAEQRNFFKDEGIETKCEIVDNAEKINEELRSGIAQIAISSI